jgi:hypothetical protein
MKTFKNIIAEKSSTVTTIQFAQGEKPTEFGKWAEVDEIELDMSGAVHLHRIGGTTYFGRL